MRTMRDRVIAASVYGHYLCGGPDGEGDCRRSEGRRDAFETPEGLEKHCEETGHIPWTGHSDWQDWMKTQKPLGVFGTDNMLPPKDSDR